MKLRRKVVVAVVLELLVISTLAVAFNTAQIKANTNACEFPSDHQMMPKIDERLPGSSNYPKSYSGSSKMLPFGLEMESNSRICCFDPNSWNLAGQNEWIGFADGDGDSVELVIGINTSIAGSYAGVTALAAEEGVEIVNTVSIDGEIWGVIGDVPLEILPSFVSDVQASDLSRYVEPNMKMQACFVPDDPYWSQQWGPQKIEADWAWNATVGDSSVLVAVIDTGVDWNHPDLAANYVALGYDWVNEDMDPMDDDGHGTHCAGIIAAVINNHVGVAGLAQVQIIAEKGLDQYGSGYEDDLANAIIHAVDQGADILSNSWGGYEASELIHDAVRYAYDAGVLVIAAAGNDAIGTELYPAAYDEVISVTATDQYDNPAYFTNFGEWVELAAPGVDIYSTYWDDTYVYMGGTSMATPHVAGVAALIWSQFPNVTHEWVRAQLRYTADDLGNPGFDYYYGYGRINARNAVEQAAQEHDLLVLGWERPTIVKLGELATFNVTVLNFGTSDETSIDVQLLINSSLIDSALIAFLQAEGATETVELSWTPTAGGTYNVTSYVVPVPGETMAQNNLILGIITVVVPPPEIGWALLATDPDEGMGTNLKAISGQLYSGIVFFKVEHHRPWTTINVIDTAIFVDADQDPSTGLPDGYYPGQNTGIGADYLIIVGWEATEMWKWDPIIDSWDVFNPISLAYLEAPDSSSSFVVGVYLASVETAGFIDCVVCDVPSNWDWMPDTSYFSWILIRYEHDLAVRLETPKYLLPGQTSLLNATVRNWGLNNETNVEIQLIINGSIVANETLIELVNGTSYAIDFSWTPALEGDYNVTAYAPPVSEEDFTLNNVKTELVSVLYPLINPEPGQFANYIMNNYDPTGNLIGSGYLNLTYDYYIEPYKIYITMWQKDFSGYIYTGWMVVNTINRFVEQGVWYGLWYPGWIETDINVGSAINLLDGTAIVKGTRMILVGPRAIDCWEIPCSMSGYPYTLWHDKRSGLWISMEVTYPDTEERFEMLLIDTNVPIGTQYEHDLSVTLDAPLRVQPGETSLLNATVHNLGLNNEANAEIQILVNDTEVASETFDDIVNGTWHTINHSWTPTIEGIYNVTAYTPPVPDENVTANNVLSKMIHVRRVDVALISDFSELLAITNILDSMGVGYDIYNDNSMHLYTEDLSLLCNYPAVIFYQNNRQITSAEHSALQSYLSSGGNLLVTGYDSLGSPDDPLLADVVRSSSTGDNVGEPDLYVVDAAHPIMNGPYGSFPAGYHVYGLTYDCDMAEADTARNAVTVAELADGYDKILATEDLPGKVVYWNGIGTDEWTWNVDCEAMFKNILAWFVIRYDHELVVSLDAPAFLEPGGSSLLNASVSNRGLNNETNVELFLLIDGNMVSNVAIPELLTGESYIINYLWTPTFLATFNVTVHATPVPGETITVNNVHSMYVTVAVAAKILAYVQYTDYYQEYANALRAIDSTFGPNYRLSELWDYTQLDSLLPGNDILLVPEQEYAGPSTMFMIGASWSITLSNFVAKGGVIIVCDFSGGSYCILTGAGLMAVSGVNYITGSTVYLVDPSDPLAEGVSNMFSAPDGAVSFLTAETNVVFNEGTFPVVIHKAIGLGHIALVGFDYYASNRDADLILGNAISLWGGTRLAIIPKNNIFYTPLTPVSTAFKLNVTIYDVADLHVWQINVTYDPSMLNCTGVSLPDDHVFAGKDYSATPVVFGTGWVSFGATLLGPELGVSVAEGRLAQLTFRIIAAPSTGSFSSDIDFSKPGADYIAETWMQDTLGNYILFAAENGYYEYISVTAVQIVDSKSGSPAITADVGETFTVNVTIVEVTDLYLWQVIVEFNNTILNAVNATIPPDNVFAGKTYFAPDAVINATVSPLGNGYVLMGASLLTEEVNVAEGVLFQINFVALAEGSTEIRIGIEAKPVMVPGETSGGDPQWSFLETMSGDEIPLVAWNGHFSWAPGLLEDLNGDGRVDMLDIRIVGDAFASYPGNPRWNPVADIVADKKIDMRDLAKVARKFGYKADTLSA